MSGICEAAVNKSVGHEQVAVFIMDAGNGYRQPRHKSKTDTDDNEENGDERQRLVFRKARDNGLNVVEQSWRQSRQKYGQKGEANGDADNYTERIRHAHQQNVNELTHGRYEFSAWDCGMRGEK